MTTLIERLIAVKQLIATPETWCTQTSARDAQGVGVPAYDPAACQWCLLGAISKICPNNKDHSSVVNYLYTHMDHLYSECLQIADLNDQEGFDAVHKLLDVAIARAE